MWNLIIFCYFYAQIVDEGGETKKCQNNAHMLDKRGEIHLLSIDVEFNHLWWRRGGFYQTLIRLRRNSSFFHQFSHFQLIFLYGSPAMTSRA